MKVELELVILSISIILLAITGILQEIRLYRIEKKIQHYRDLFGGDR